MRELNLSGYSMLLFDLAAIEDDETELHSAVYSLRLMYPQTRIIALELRDGQEERLERLREVGVENVVQRAKDLPIALSPEGMKEVVIRRKTAPKPVVEDHSSHERIPAPAPDPVLTHETQPPDAEETPPRPDIIIPPAQEFRETDIHATGHSPPTSASPILPAPEDSADTHPSESKRHKRPFVLREKKRKPTAPANASPEQNKPQARTDESPSVHVASESIPEPTPELVPIHPPMPVPTSAEPPETETLAGVRLPRLGLRRPPKRAKPVTVGVCGIMRRMGTTTHVLGIAAYLVAQGEAAYCIEANDHGHFGRFSQYHDVVHTEDGAEAFKGIPIAFPDAPVPESAHFLVYDFGLLDDCREAFEQCDIRVLCIGSKPWELSWLGRLFQSRTDLLMHAHYIVGFTGEEERGKMLSIMGRLAERTHFAAYAPSLAEGMANDPIYESILAKRKRYTLSKGDDTP